MRIYAISINYYVYLNQLLKTHTNIQRQLLTVATVTVLINRRNDRNLNSSGFIPNTVTTRHIYYSDADNQDEKQYKNNTNDANIPSTNKARVTDLSGTLYHDELELLSLGSKFIVSQQLKENL